MKSRLFKGRHCQILLGDHSNGRDMTVTVLDVNGEPNMELMGTRVSCSYRTTQVGSSLENVIRLMRVDDVHSVCAHNMIGNWAEFAIPEDVTPLEPLKLS